MPGGDGVVAIDDFSLGTRENIKEAEKCGNFTLIEGDVSDPQFWQQLITTQPGLVSTDVIWHLAANSDILAGVVDPNVDLQKTFLTSFHTLEAARILKIKERVGERRAGDLRTSLVSRPTRPEFYWGSWTL